MSKKARPRRRVPAQGGVAAKAGPAVERGAIAEKAGMDNAVLAPFEFPLKQRCQGVTRYGQHCHLWATAGSDFCYWCERAGRPRHPLAKHGDSAGPASARKQRFRGVTVFGEPCGYFSAGQGGLCRWCQGADERRKEAGVRQ